jgi:Pectinacetylesterase
MGRPLRTWAIATAVMMAAAAAPKAVLGGPPPVASINVGSADGTPGSFVQINVTLELLTTPPNAVVGTSNDIIFKPEAPVVAATVGGGPACAVNPAIRKVAVFEFIPSGCAATQSCTGVNALVVPDQNSDAIPDGAILYTCTIQIAGDAASGTYTLENDVQPVLDANDSELAAAGSDGSVTVTQPALACVGDCGGDGMVTVADLVRGVNISLGAIGVDVCPKFDRDGDGIVLVNELILGVNAALAGCLPDPEICERAAAMRLAQCVRRANEAQRTCYATGGRACPPDDGEIADALLTLSESVPAACPDAATVQAAGYGPSFTVDGLVGRLQSACRAEAAALAARTFGGPQGAALAAPADGGSQGAALAAGTTATKCLNAAHAAGTEFLGHGLALYGDCIFDARDGGACVGLEAGTAAAALEQKLADDVTTACGAGALQELIAVDSATYAARAAAQVRCLTATAHPDPAPFALDCGPRDGLAATPRGEYVQIILDNEQYGTRCGDGSPFAFWIRLAPDGEPVEDVVVGMQGGGVCIGNDDCRTRPADLFEAVSDQPQTGGPLSNDPAISPFAAWTKVYLPYCNQDVFIGGGSTNNFPDITVERFGAVNVRAAMRYVRDAIWRELDQTTENGYTPDRMRVLFGGFSAGAFGTLYNYHYLLDDLQWAHTAAYPDAGLALDNGEVLGVGTLGALLIASWQSHNYLAPYCFAFNCGVGPVLLNATAPRLKAVPEQQFLILSNQVDDTQVGTTFFASVDLWVNQMRASYCDTRDLNGVQYYLPAITDSVHVISPREELYTSRPVDGVIMRDWLAGAFTNPDDVTDRVEEGTLVQDIPGVMPFPCDIE